MKNDPVMDEVRRIRRETDARFQDTKAYYDFLVREQEKFARLLVTRQPQPLRRGRVA